MKIYDLPLPVARTVFIREYLTLQLYWNGGNVTKTAQALQLTRDHLIRLIRKHGLQPAIEKMRKRTYTLPKTWVSFVQPIAPDNSLI